MGKTQKNRSYMSLSVSKPSALELRGRQSVRATFRLSEDCIDAISILSAQLGIKQKSVFDHLMEDVQVLKNMASELENTEFDRHDRVQKTFVISRRSSILFRYHFQHAQCPKGCPGGIFSSKACCPL